MISGGDMTFRWATGRTRTPRFSHAAGFLEGREVCPWVDLMLLVFLANFFGVVFNIVSASHDYSPLLNPQTDALTRGFNLC